MAQADIAMIGLAVMGQNLGMNIADHSFTVAVYNRTTSVVDDFVDGPVQGMSTAPTHSLEEMVAALRRPRRVLMLLEASQPVDDLLGKLILLLEPGDIIVNGGNLNYEDSLRRTDYVESKGLRFTGTGVSGGEEGTRNGLSIMPAGSPAAWPAVKPTFQAVAAKVPEGDPNGAPCCDWVGEGGAGHFAKMVHNGIEHGDTQIIAEAYQLMKEGLGLSNDEMSAFFGKWNTGVLESYLIQITRDMLGCRDKQGQAVVDVILDSTGQKNTGKWTVSSALDQGTPLTLVGEAMFARFLSALVDERAGAAQMLPGPTAQFTGDKAAFLTDLEQAVYAANIASYAQGYMLMRAAAQAYGWHLSLGGIALMWRGGCIMRSVFLGKIKEAFDANPELSNLLLAPYFRAAMATAEGAWRGVVAAAVHLGIPVPALSSALAFYDDYRRERLPANLAQAQRNSFGTYTYERVDRARAQFFHTNWTGHGGDVTSPPYQA